MSAHVRKLRKMRRAPASVVLFLALTILLLPMLHRPIRPPLPSRAATRANATLAPPRAPECVFITPPSAVWSYNSRSHCVFPRLCLTPTRLAVPASPAVCTSVTAAFLPFAASRRCAPPDLARVTCAYTDGMLSGKPSCLAPARLEPLDAPTLARRVVVVPHYPFPANIYHFANARTTLLHHVRHTRHPPAMVLFRGAPNRNAWQASFHEIIVAALRALAPAVKVQYLPREETFCGRDVTVLGRRGHINVWPFPNTTAVVPTGREVPLESIDFRRAFYDAFAIPHALPVDTHPTWGAVTTIPHPPLVLGYARRLGPGADTGGNVHAIGTMRRFSESDEAWFQAMLKEETSRQNVRLHVFTTSAKDSLKAQVTNFAGLGAVIGIHGANLVNTMFMPPLSVLIEVFPAQVTSLCYYAGGNAGLKYIRFESADAASPEESGCDSGRCLLLSRQRLVKIGRESERVRLRENVREGLSYLTGLRTGYPAGVRVVNDPARGVYKVLG